MEHDPSSMPTSYAELLEMREELELGIRQWFLDTDSDFTFEDVLEAVFEEEDTDDLQHIIMMFDDGDPLSMSTAIELATDAWNYFPHRTLGGKSPAELYDGELEKTEQAMEVMDLELNPEAHVKGELDEKTAFALFNKKMLTGESLYAFTGGYEFVTNFKKDVDTYNANLGLVYNDDDPEQKGDHLDQELLIADKNNAGELNIFSAYGMATGTLKIFLESQIYFKETESESGIRLEFKDPRMKEAFMRMKEDLIEGYATLLSFVEMYKRLSKIYDVDLMYQVKKWLDVLGDYIDQHNEALRIAAGQTEDEDRMFRKHRPVLEIDEALFIDKEKIEPDRGKVMVYFEKLGELFGNEFGSYEEASDETEEENL